ncbi:DUF5977 domain-containing protein [Flavobacterium sp. N2038]|uniref:DUF5977 domain-containing protein n=1 Tax=Flavobacterium sp. N2038 TaxID=2986829 RepID=UPI00222505F9|nr:DUF5977 domain-containing protein [Flavobacterium sp. N2038]
MILKTLIKFSFYFLVAFTSLQALAQHEPEPMSLTPVIVPPPPNSASLGLYGQVPLDQFTGNGIINMPLHTIKSGNIELPISLSYSSDGVKVDQYESNVGMGWALNAGGVITRQVFDYQDNYRGRLQKPNTESSPSEMLAFLEQASNNPETDTQPDIYSYNFGGISGKFFLDNNNVPVEIEPTGIRIEITSDFLNIGSGVANPNPEIIITNTNGIKYFFGGLGAVESSLVRDLSKEGPRTTNVKTSWYLTRIVDPTTNQEITLNYDGNPANIQYLSGLEQTLSYKEVGFHPMISLTTAKYNSFSNESLLKEITSSDTKITFTYSKRFSDNDFNFMKVDEINCYDKKDKLINKIKLSYTEYAGDSFSNYNYLPLEIRSSPNYLTKRFYLSKINEHSNSINSKIHEFEYYSPELLPARFSFAKDHYGLFNGKNNTTLITEDAPVPNSVKYPVNLSYTQLANRNPDSNFGYFGLLKKIIYPTKGTTTLVYEPHLDGKVTVPVFPDKASLDINLKTLINERYDSQTYTIFSSYDQTIKLDTYAQFNSFCRDIDPTYEPTHDPSGSINIIDLSTNAYVSFWNHEDKDLPVLIGEHYNFNQDSPTTDSVTFKLKANTSYKVTVNISSAECVMVGASFNYYENPVTQQEVDVQVGGFRVQKTINNSLSNGRIETEKYFYDSGSYISRGPLAYIRKIDRNNNCEYPAQSMLLSVSSADLGRIYSSQNAQFGYASVTKSYGENFENGGEEFTYNITQDQIPYLIQGEDDKTTPYTNGFGTGRLLNHKIFKIGSSKKHIIQQETTNEYKHDESKDKSVNGVVVYRSREDYTYGTTLPGGTGNPAPVCLEIVLSSSFSVNQYSVRSQWNYLKKTTKKSFDKNGENPVILETNYNYSNPSHLQLTSQTTTNSKQETLESRFFYAGDSEMVSKPFVTELQSANMIGIPLSTVTLKGGIKISEQLTNYDKSVSTNNLLLPKSVYGNKGASGIDLNLDKKMTYDLYDAKGNVLQYTPESGTPVSIIWGYNKTQPIAKIENIAYTVIPAETITNLQTLSNADSDNCLSVNCTEQMLRKELETFRNSLPNTFISTYTYNPLVGVTSITDPKGITTYYEYDTYGRLKFVKDKELNVLQKYCYNYKGENIDCSDNTSTSVVMYKSIARSGSFVRDNCVAGGVASSEVYNQAVGAVISTISQADADDLGLIKFNTDGQANANAKGTCTFSSIARSGYFTRNNCAAGGAGSSVAFSQAAGAVTSTISQAHADDLGLTKFNEDGQANANVTGTCTFSSIARSGSFIKNNCAPGGVPSSVAFSQVAGAQTSNVSQADADAKGFDLFNINGQINANANGTCTFRSIARSGSFIRNNCSPGGSGTSVDFSQVAGIETSMISQEDADSKALSVFNTNGQANANANGRCFFSNVAMSETFTRNSCPDGGTPGTFTYTVPAGRYTMDVSQAFVDKLALHDIMEYGQNAANEDGVCTYYSTSKSGVFTRNDCGSSYGGSSVTYYVPARKYTSVFDQAGADALAQADVNNNGQAYANANGLCVFKSIARSGYFTKYCASGGTGSIIAYNQGAGAASSTVSQADADALGLIKFNTDGQNYANAQGICTIDFTYEYFFNTSSKELIIDVMANGTGHNGATFTFEITYKRLSPTPITRTEIIVFPAGQADKTYAITLVGVNSVLSVNLVKLIRN